MPIYNLMEDAATAEISRTQVWQWLHHGAKLNDGRVVSLELVRSTSACWSSFARSSARVTNRVNFRSPLNYSSKIGTSNDQLGDFLTLAAYKYL